MKPLTLEGSTIYEHQTITKIP